MRPFRAAAIAVALVLGTAGPASAGPYEECLLNPNLTADTVRAVDACTEVITNPAWPQEVIAQAFANRALAYSVMGDYERAIRDYNSAIDIAPNYATALNNRAWAYFRSGRPELGLADVEKSLRLNPLSPHAYDTRAHIRQSAGDTARALRDYEMSLNLGGERMIKLYQCGLAEAGLYKGQQDGKDSKELREALSKCVLDKKCDPLPQDEQCRPRAM
ncbi:MAG TPA: tetratricopeptide repeat protein [Hyphomicrobiaceae bacterium]|nr:tetratricopeptide repeat protein [Hyphomicrobiaceae bacterium]